MALIDIKIPNRQIKSHGVEARINWSPQFIRNVNNALGSGKQLQRYADAAILESTTPYLPFKTGVLANSGKSNTKIGSGLLVWKTPYARYLYYGILMVDPKTGSPWARKGARKIKASPETPLKYRHLQPKSGPFWCERWKRDNLSTFEKDLQRKAGELIWR